MLRDAAVDDAFAIATVHVASWRAAYRGLLPDELLAELSVETFAARRREKLTAGEPVIVCEQSAAIVGFVSYGPSRDDDDGGEDGEIYALYLHPSVWSRGHGHALHDAAIDRLSAAGHERLVLWVLAGNDRALRFYQRHGWLPDGAVKNMVRSGTVTPEMRLTRTSRLVVGD